MTRTQRISVIAGLFFTTGAVVLPMCLNASRPQLDAVRAPFSNLSDRTMKENFEPVDPADVLDRVMSMPISTWNYRNQSDSIRHMGPMAQDFWPAFGLGEHELRISTVDANGVALAAIQGLGDRLNDTNAQIDVLHNECQALRDEMGGSQQPAEGGIAGTIDRFFAIPGNAFVPKSNLFDYSLTVSGVTASGTGQGVQFFAPVHLPHGAVVTGMEAQLFDNSSTQNVTLQLAYIADTSGGGGMATMSSAGSLAAVQTISTNTITQGATIDNKSRSYYVNCYWTVPSPSYNIKLFRVLISYTITEPLP